jgi:hypothetical protein
MVRNPQLLSIRRILSLLSAILQGMRKETSLKQELLLTNSEGAFLEIDWDKLVELGVMERNKSGFYLVERPSLDWHGLETIDEAFAEFRRG